MSMKQIGKVPVYDTHAALDTKSKSFQEIKRTYSGTGLGKAVCSEVNATNETLFLMFARLVWW